MSYNFVSDFWKIYLLGKAVFFNQDQIVNSTTGEEFIVGPEDCLFIHNYGNEKDPIKPRPQGYLVASLIKKMSDKDEIIDLELPCEFIRDYHTLETNQVFQYIDKIKKEYFESNERLVSHNLKIIKTELAIDQQFMSSDFAGLKKSLKGIDQDQERLIEIFNEYASANVELVNVLLLEQRIMQALILKAQIQKKYFDENFKFGLDLQKSELRLNASQLKKDGIYILDHLISIEPYLCTEIGSFEFEKITFETVIKFYIEKIKNEGSHWFPKTFIGLFSSIYFKNKYAYIFSDGNQICHIIVDSNTLLSLPKHKAIISLGSFTKISLNAGSFIRKFSRLVDSYEDYQVSNLAHFIIVLEQVTSLDLPTLHKVIKIHELGTKLDPLPNIEYRLDLSESFEHKALVSLRHIIALKDKYDLFGFMDQNTGKDKLYSTYANNQLQLNINGHLLLAVNDGFTEGIIKKVPGYGNVLFVEIKTVAKRLELRLPMDFVEKAERATLRSMCIPIVNQQDKQYIHEFFHSYQYLAQDSSNFKLYHLATLALNESNQHHNNFIKTLVSYFETELGLDSSTAEFKQQLSDVVKSLLSIFGYSKLQMLRPNMVHLKIWHEAVEQIKLILNVHSYTLQKVNLLCKINQIAPIALYNSPSNDFMLVAESKHKDDRICQAEWVDLHSIDLQTDKLVFVNSVVEMPDGWSRIYEWMDHIFINKKRPIIFKGKDVKQQFMAALSKMPDWLHKLDVRQPFDLTTFRRIFNKVDRCIEYMLVTGELGSDICLFKPFRMYMDGNTLMVEGHHFASFGELLYVSAPDQNAREDVIQMLLSYLQAIYPDSYKSKLLEIVGCAESLAANPHEMVKLRPIDMIAELSSLPLNSPTKAFQTLSKVIQVPMKNELLNLEKNHYVYFGDVWAKPD